MAVVALTSTVLRAVLFYRPQVCDDFLRLDGGVRSASITWPSIGRQVNCMSREVALDVAESGGHMGN